MYRHWKKIKYLKSKLFQLSYVGLAIISRNSRIHCVLVFTRSLSCLLNTLISPWSSSIFSREFISSCSKLLLASLLSTNKEASYKTSGGKM
uniref:Ovule protein n=1 Tax=Schistosoma curassoni TaxID=6186 RepID=A0A183KJN9_9TREM